MIGPWSTTAGGLRLDAAKTAKENTTLTFSTKGIKASIGRRTNES